MLTLFPLPAPPTRQKRASVAENHAYVDMGVYHSEDEMRKQCGHMRGKIIVTGQESVQGSAHPLREDLFKKHATGNPIACRLPYGKVTSMVKLVGWKRFEMNNLIEFKGVSGQTINSIFRRMWVCVLKASFLRKNEWLKIESPEPKGAFLRDDSLETFVNSGPAACAHLLLLRGFLSARSQKCCEDVIEKYANGGDDGVTLRCARTACGLDAEVPVDKAKNGENTSTVRKTFWGGFGRGSNGVEILKQCMRAFAFAFPRVYRALQ